jgi:hypothetical protein
MPSRAGAPLHVLWQRTLEPASLLHACSCRVRPHGHRRTLEPRLRRGR